MMVRSLVPLLNVEDVERSSQFYAALGFAMEDQWRQEGQLLWARMRAGDVRLPGAPGARDRTAQNE